MKSVKLRAFQRLSSRRCIRRDSSICPLHPSSPIPQRPLLSGPGVEMPTSSRPPELGGCRWPVGSKCRSCALGAHPGQIGMGSPPHPIQRRPFLDHCRHPIPHPISLQSYMSRPKGLMQQKIADISDETYLWLTIGVLPPLSPLPDAHPFFGDIYQSYERIVATFSVPSLLSTLHFLTKGKLSVIGWRGWPQTTAV